MTRRVVDISDYQAGLNIDAAAAAVDGVWCKVGDWAWVARYGPPGDNIHDLVIARCKQIGKPVGSYLFVRPGQTDPKTQVDWWRANCPDGTTMAPMIDLEKTVITGSSLSDWVGEALDLTARAFGVTPVLYWSATFANAYGMTAPAAAHVPMVAEYHRGYTPFLWADRDSWESYAYAAFGGPDVPPGYGAAVTSRSLIWQATSSAQIPGFLGLVDLDFVPDEAFRLITDASLPPASVDDIEAILMADPNLAANLTEFVRVYGPGGPHDLRDVWNIAQADHPMINMLYHIAVDPTDGGSSRWAVQEAKVNAINAILTDPNRAAGGLISFARDSGNGQVWIIFGTMWRLYVPDGTRLAHFQTHWAAHGADTTVYDWTPEDLELVPRADVRVDAGGVDVDALVAKVVAGIVASGIKADVDAEAIARAVLDGFRDVWASTGTPTKGPADTADDVPLADPNPSVRAEVALADLTRSVFDPDAGIVATVAGQVEKMAKTADGAAPTPAQIRDAFEAASADATQRAAWLAANPPTGAPSPPATT